MLNALLLGITPAMVHLSATAQPSSSLVESLGIEVREGSREFAFTNKQTAYYYGETHAANRSAWQGFNVAGQEVLDDYEIEIDDQKLDRSSALSVVVYPDYMKRVYAGNIIETVRLADSIALLALTISSPTAVHVDVVPLFTGIRSADQVRVHLHGDAVLLARKPHRAEIERAPLWLAMRGLEMLPQQRTTRRRNSFSPILLVSRARTEHTFVFAAGETAEEAERVARIYLAQKDAFDTQRRERMERLLRETLVETENQRFNRALAWAKLSLDALIMHQKFKGIFAGLPWFNNYWGRDTFIALPGATLVVGRFREAKEILRSFASAQQLDSSSSEYGRIPNIITPTERAYNTADGTPRFVVIAREYIDRSGDTAFIREISPSIVRSIEGTLRYHSDSLGFLTHADADTWMDAVGPEGACSPRGNRANDVQALWAQQLDAGVWFAEQLGDSAQAHRWRAQLDLLRKNFQQWFVHGRTIVDHLNADGSADAQMRPNQIFTAPLLNDTQRASVVQTVINKLTYTYGVASLSQEDENFHPFHVYPPYYPKDAAYHNGTVWTWLQALVISELCRFDRHEFAYQLTDDAIHQILDRGAVGTQSELLEAIPRPGETEARLSGTFSQAWNLAEFIRNFYDDYLGVRVSLRQHHLALRPRLPNVLGTVRATINFDGRSLPIVVHRSGDSTLVTIDAKNLRTGGSAEISLLTSRGTEIRGFFAIQPHSNILSTLHDTSLSIEINGVREMALRVIHSQSPTALIPEPLAFVHPRLRPELRALKGPPYPLIAHEAIKAENPKARTLVRADDPVGDDKGDGSYTYPLNPHFVPGAFDITHFAVSVDDRNAYFDLRFRALADPGWHPEYGFQLTFIAIALDTNGRATVGTREVGRNAQFVLPARRAYQRIIYIGGGVEIEDDQRTILAAYIPSEGDVSNPLGDASTATIRFALPLAYLGIPTSRWTFTVLVGGQDDHGGAGLGEFRAVSTVADEWHGGGKRRVDQPNVYDVLIAPAQSRQ